MKKNFNQNLYTLNDEQIFNDVEKSKPATMKQTICDALVFPHYPGEERLDGTEKVKRFNLAVRINKADADVDVSIEELSLIKELIGKFAAPIIVGPVYNYIEEKAPKPALVSRTKKKG